MKIPQIAIIKYTINDIKLSDSLRDDRIHDLRKHTDVLIIDDENFEPKAFLERNNFRLTSKSDIDNVKDVSEYPIILCDIRGVGRKLSEKYEGAFLIKEIKSNYPEKTVIAYTASQYDPSYNPYLELADTIVPKSMSAEEWLDILDQYIIRFADPVIQWKVIRERLLKIDTSLLDIARLENSFVKSYYKDEFSGLKKMAKALNKDVDGIVSEFLSKVVLNLTKRGT